MTKIEDQPPPKVTEHPAVWPMVRVDVITRYDETPPNLHTKLHDAVVTALLGDMAERDQLGRERYGVPLTAHNGRDHLVDAYQEMLDLAVYLRAAMVERNLTAPGLDETRIIIERGREADAAIRAMYAGTLSALLDMRCILLNGGLS